MDRILPDGSVLLDGRTFADCSSALDYLLALWGSHTSQQCRDAEMYLGTLYQDRS